MTDTERQVSIGRTVEEYQEKTVRAKAIQAELNLIGDALQKLGAQLKQSPTAVLHQSHPDAFDLDKIGTLINELRALDPELQRLKTTLRGFGVSAD